MIALTTAKLLKSFTAVTLELLGRNTTFSHRIKKRHTIFWSDPNAEDVRCTIMHATDPAEKWQDVENWQRKLSNKYNSREFASKYGCKVAELYWKGRNVSCIDFNHLPDHFVIRPTIGHSLNMVFVMRKSENLMDGKTYSHDDIRQVLEKALAENDRLEFLIEEFVRTEAGDYKIPDDYKLYMFNGKIACIQVINRENNKKGYTSWYDENWNPLPNLTTNFPDGESQPRPACFDEMVEYARRLSEAYKIFIRIDLYGTDKGAIFGEVTPTPALGKGFTPFAEKLFNKYWDQFCKGMI